VVGILALTLGERLRPRETPPVVRGVQGRRGTVQRMEMVKQETEQMLGFGDGW
jgi:hypothetical protein